MAPTYRVSVKISQGRGFPHGACSLKVLFGTTYKKTAESGGPAPAWNADFAFDALESIPPIRIEGFNSSKSIGTLVLDPKKVDLSRMDWMELRGSPRQHHPEIRLMVTVSELPLLVQSPTRYSPPARSTSPDNGSASPGGQFEPVSVKSLVISMVDLTIAAGTITQTQLDEGLCLGVSLGAHSSAPQPLRASAHINFRLPAAPIYDGEPLHVIVTSGRGSVVCSGATVVNVAGLYPDIPASTSVGLQTAASTSVGTAILNLTLMVPPEVPQTRAALELPAPAMGGASVTPSAFNAATPVKLSMPGMSNMPPYSAFAGVPAAAAAVAPGSPRSLNTADSSLMRMQPEYALAWELEMWRKTEETKWREQLQVREAARMRQLEEQFRVRETERDNVTRKAREHCEKLEQDLNRQLLDVQRHEARVQMREEQLQLHQQTLQHEQERRIAEANDSAKRQRDEFQQQSALQRSRYTELEEQHRATLERLNSTLERATQLERDLVEVRLQLPAERDRLSADLLRMRTENAELQDKLRTATQERDAALAKTQRAVNEVIRMRQEQEHGRKAKLRDHELKLQRQRLEQMATQARDESQADRNALATLKQQLMEMKLQAQQVQTLERLQHQQEHQEQMWQQQLAHLQKEQTATPIHAPPSQQEPVQQPAAAAVAPPVVPVVVAPVPEPVDTVQREAIAACEREIARLQREQQNMLATGVYSPADKIVSRLGDRIVSEERKLVALRG
eukprot:TRINITY_DN12037_c0_g1_i1.p1 TRINITY_DN12037_c0_g1~~TRINITY_DN12037_c0_g1_i1.p1  ORF type:complete len:736 (-),score=190.18 TRINITY_DN12037_c0_g1_i1:23-2230(-)